MIRCVQSIGFAGQRQEESPVGEADWGNVPDITLVPDALFCPQGLGYRHPFISLVRCEMYVLAV